MLRKLSTKFILIFALILTGVFVLTVLSVRIIANIYVEGFIRDNVARLQRDTDDAVTEVIDEAAYLYARMVKQENIGLLNALGDPSPIAKQNAFADLVRAGNLNEFYFVDAGWYDDGSFYSLSGGAPPPGEVFTRAEENKNKIVAGSYADNCLTLAVHMSNDYSRTEGTFVFYLLESVLSDICGTLNADAGYSFIMLADGYVVSHDDKSYVGKTLIYQNLFSLDREGYQFAAIGGADKLIAATEMETLNSRYGFGMYLVDVLDYGYYYGLFNRLTLIFVILAVAVFAIGVVLAVIRSKAITRPVEQLNKSIEGVIETGKKPGHGAGGGDELYQLEQKYDEMIDRIFTLMRKNKEDMEEQRKLELDALQMQINPHFLYNTLDAVVWMAKIKKEPEIENLVLNLARFFRLALHKGDKFITVGEEIEITEHYLEIEKIRFPDKTQAVFDADDELKNYTTLKLILQPIVENAVKYAFPDNNGHVRIGVAADGEDIVYTVEDDGAGFVVPENILKVKNEKKASGGYGLYNVNERIKLEYGEKYGLTVESEEGKGTRVTARIAKRLRTYGVSS